MVSVWPVGCVLRHAVHISLLVCDLANDKTCHAATDVGAAGQALGSGVGRIATRGIMVAGLCKSGGPSAGVEICVWGAGGVRPDDSGREQKHRKS
mgnify:CR=1 FL=1